MEESIDLLKRIYLKFHCDRSDEPDSVILEDVRNFLSNSDPGFDEFMENISEEEDLGDFWKKENEIV